MNNVPSWCREKDAGHPSFAIGCWTIIHNGTPKSVADCDNCEFICKESFNV